jgi:hypothetical protein
VDDATIGKYSVSLSLEPDLNNSGSHDPVSRWTQRLVNCELKSPFPDDDTRRGCYRASQQEFTNHLSSSGARPADDATIGMYSDSLPPESEINNNSGPNTPEFSADPTACFTARRLSPSRADTTIRTCCHPTNEKLPNDDTVGCYRVSHDDAEGCYRVSHGDRHSSALPADDATNHSYSSCVLPEDDATIGTGAAISSMPYFGTWNDEEASNTYSSSLPPEPDITDSRPHDPQFLADLASPSVTSPLSMESEATNQLWTVLDSLSDVLLRM